MRAVDALEVLELVGSGQWGLVTSSQAQEAGVSPVWLARLTERGTLRRVRHGVYALPSADSGPLQELRAAWLATGSRPLGPHPTAVVSGQSAATVHGLGDLLPSLHEFASEARRQTTQRDIRYRKRGLEPDEVTRVDGLPVTTVVRTVADLAAGSTDFDHLAGVVRDALQDRATTSAELAEALEPAADRFDFDGGGALLAALLKHAGFKPDTGLARAFSSDMQQSLFDAVAPGWRDAVSQIVRTELRQALPPINLTPQVAQLADSIRPQMAEFNKALLKPPATRWPDVRKALNQDGTLTSEQTEAEETTHDADPGRGRSGQAASVPKRKTGRRSQKPRRRS